MPDNGSTDSAVKAVSPEWGRNEVKSLDRAEASRSMEGVMVGRRDALNDFDGRVA